MGTITKGATTMGTLLEAIETAGRHVGKVLDGPNMTSWERDFVLSRAAEALAHVYFKATGKPLKW